MVNIRLTGAEEKKSFGPVAFARRFFEEFDRGENGKIMGEIATLRWDSGDISRIKITSTPKNFSNDFTMRNTRGGRIDSRNFTDIGELGGDYGDLGRLTEVTLEETSGYVGEGFEFAEINAASIGLGGYITSYEFTYEMIIKSASVENASITEEVIEEYNHEV